MDLENALIYPQEKTKEKVLTLFREIKEGKKRNLTDILEELDSFGCLNTKEKDFSEFKVSAETIEHFKMRQEAKDLIKEALKVGVLQAAGSRRVYVWISEDGTEENCYQSAELLDDAALSLVESGNVEMLREAVEKAKESENG